MALKHLKNPFPAIYHHSNGYRQLYQKSKICPKSWFLRFWCIFDPSQYGRSYGRKFSKMRLDIVNAFSESSKHIWLPWMTSNDDLDIFLKSKKDHVCYLTFPYMFFHDFNHFLLLFIICYPCKIFLSNIKFIFIFSRFSCYGRSTRKKIYVLLENGKW